MAVWAEQHALYIRFLPQHSQEGLNCTTNKDSLRAYCPALYTVLHGLTTAYLDWLLRTIKKSYIAKTHYCSVYYTPQFNKLHKHDQISPPLFEFAIYWFYGTLYTKGTVSIVKYLPWFFFSEKTSELRSSSCLWKIQNAKLTVHNSVSKYRR